MLFGLVMSKPPLCVALATALLLSACGFRLIGTRPLPSALQTVYVSVDAPYRVSEPPVQTALRTRLKRRGATVVSKPDQALTQVRLFDLSEQRETLSIGPDGKALEYRLVISVRFEVRQGTTLLQSPDQLTVSRDYSFRADQILAKEGEESQLREFIQDEMAELVLLRLEAVLASQPAPPSVVVPVIPPAMPAPAN